MTGITTPEFFGNSSAFLDEFDGLFSITYADSLALKRVAYTMRKSAYYQDENYENIGNYKLDIDQYDGFSHHILIKHKATDLFAGAVRLITPVANGRNKIPLQERDLEAICAGKSPFSSLSTGRFSEISKLVIPTNLSYMTDDLEFGLLPSDLTRVKQLAEELPKLYPVLTLGLFIAASALSRHLGYYHLFAEMTPMMFKKIRGSGLLFDQASYTYKKNGTKAIYSLNLFENKAIARSLSGMFGSVCQEIDSQLRSDVQPLQSNYGTSIRTGTA